MPQYTLSECYELRFPKFLGDTSGSTGINAFDVDSSGDVVMAGTSYATDIVSTAGYGYVALLPYNQLDFLWIR